MMQCNATKQCRIRSARDSCVVNNGRWCSADVSSQIFMRSMSSMWLGGTVLSKDTRTVQEPLLLNFLIPAGTKFEFERGSQHVGIVIFYVTCTKLG